MSRPFTNDDRSIEQGTIQIWAGVVTSIPPGWAVCDGNNGTPDLTDKFVKSVASAGDSPGTVVGNHQKTIGENELPTHTHGGTTDNSVINHYHKVGHYGTYARSDEDHDEELGSENGVANASHSHQFTAATTGSTPQAMENRPAFYEVAFITKL